MTNYSLLLAVSAFVGAHFFLSWLPVRCRLVSVMGEKLYLGAYSCIVTACLVWMSLAFAQEPRNVLWDLGLPGRIVCIGLMPLAFILAVLGLLARNPSALWGRRTDLEHPKGVQTITRHPYLWGATLWAIGHLAANGNQRSLLLFGGIAILSLFGMKAIDGKRARQFGSAWRFYAEQTSIVPFAAVLAHRTRIDWAGIGWRLPLIGLTLFIAVLYGHPYIFDSAALL